MKPGDEFSKQREEETVEWKEEKVTLNISLT